MKTLNLSLFIVFLLTACSDDDVLTTSQLTPQKLKKDIKAPGQAKITSVAVVDFYDGSFIFVGSTYAITSDGFITITTDADASATFNLRELKRYEIGTNSLTLYY